MNSKKELDNLKRQIGYLKRNQYITENVITVQKRVVTGLLLIIGILLAMLISSRISLGGEINRLNTVLAASVSDNEALSMEKVQLTNDLEALARVAAELEAENTELVSDNLQLQDEWHEMSDSMDEMLARQELFDKYEYAIVRPDNTRTDITYDNLRHLEEIAEEEGMSEDAIHLALSFVMCESNGIASAANPTSSARGFGQLLDSTGRFAYYNLCGYTGTYNHYVDALDGDLNLEMQLRTLSYMDNYYHGNTRMVVTNYCGSWMPWYVAKLDHYLAYSGLSVATVDIHP